MAFSGYKNQRRRTGKRGRREEKKLSFLCFFSRKQRRPRRETMSSGGRKQPVLHHVSVFSAAREELTPGTNKTQEQENWEERVNHQERERERERERKKQTKQTKKNARDRTNGGKTERQGGEEQKCINRGAGEKKNARDRISFNHLFTIFSNPSASRNPDRRRTPISSVQTTIIIDYRLHLPIIAQATTQEGRT